MVAALLMAAGCLATGGALAQAGWPSRLQAELAKVDAQSKARIGVYVQDMDSGDSMSYKADLRWYLASTVKVPVAIAVLRGVEQDRYNLDTKVTLRASDYVDGAGQTNKQPVGKALSIRFLLDQMIIYSDNAATDMLIGLVGVGEVNAVLESLVPEGFTRITTLGDIRRMVYGNLTPAAGHLSGPELLLLHRQPTDADRLRLLAQLVDTPVARFQLKTLDAAWTAYYATGLNSGRLDAYGELLVKLAQGQALGPRYTDYLLKVMERVATGERRIKAALPPDAKFAHKTGTQRRRTCDSGIVRMAGEGPARRVIVVACTRDEPSTARSELALQHVGAAICRSGLLTEGMIDAPICTPAPSGKRLPAAPVR
ncbi:MAG: serine hydrolase [Polaromonas sp.]|nr:serine hydrolase [Polaromonas sp.]